MKFQENILELIEQGCDTFIEIGPHPTLNGMGKRCLPVDPKHSSDSIEWVATIYKDQVDSEALSASLAKLYTRGFDLDWAKIGSFSQNLMRFSGLPGYAFQGERFWQIADKTEQAYQGNKQNILSAPLKPTVGELIQTPTPFHIFQLEISDFLNRDLFVLKGTQVPIFSHAAVLAFSLMTANEVFGEGQYKLRNFEFPTLSFPLPGGPSSYKHWSQKNLKTENIRSKYIEKKWIWIRTISTGCNVGEGLFRWIPILPQVCTLT